MKTRRGSLVRRGRTYYAMWTVAGRKYMKTTGKTDKREAKVRLAEIMRPFLIEDEAAMLESVKARIEGAKAELAAFDDAAHPPLTVAGAWDAYERAGNRKEIAPGTMQVYDCYWTAFARWLAEAHPEVKELRGVTFNVCEDYREHLIARGVTGRTCNAHRAFLRAFWNVLAEKARLPNGNPWARIAKRDEHSVSRHTLTVEELRRVCQTADGELRVMLAFGLFLGARLGDAACMDWGNVDMARRLIRYTPRKTARNNPDALEIPMHPELWAVLSETPPARRRGPVTPDMLKRYTGRGVYAVSILVQNHFKACGLTTTNERNGAGIRRAVSAGFHSLRHTAVSMLHEAGAVQSISQALVGHNSPDVHALYTHTDPAAMRRAVGTLPSVMADRPLALPAPREPLPQWARVLVEGATAQTWEAIRNELLAVV